MTARIEAATARVEIQQLAVRYAQALDARDLDALAALWDPDVWMGKAWGGGETGVRRFFEPVLRRFYRSIHMIVGHGIDLLDATHARGQVYCRAEHESGPDWVVQAIVYEDDYRFADGRWGFLKRRHHHWYSSPIDKAPTAPSFEDWPGFGGPPPNLPQAWPTWTPFWERAGPDAILATTTAPDAPRQANEAVSIKPADRLEIHELAARYGMVIDDRDWEGLAKVFTEDAVFRLEGFGAGDTRVEGLAAIRAYMAAARHPVAHHVTNVVIDTNETGVTLRSKIVGTLDKGRAGSADYRDQLRRTSSGWRIAERAVALRRGDRV